MSMITGVCCSRSWYTTAAAYDPWAGQLGVGDHVCAGLFKVKICFECSVSQRVRIETANGVISRHNCRGILDALRYSGFWPVESSPAMPAKLPTTSLQSLESRRSM